MSVFKKPKDIATSLANIVGGLLVRPIETEESSSLGVHKRGARPEPVVLADDTAQLSTMLGDFL